MKQTAITAFAAASLALALGCGTYTESFEPAERATGVSPGGYAAAEYELGSGRFEFGEARVWSRGAVQAEVGGAERTVLHVAFDVENTSEQPIALRVDQIVLDAMVDDRSIRNVRPVRIEGAPQIAPEGATTVHAYFALPGGVTPQDIDAFRVRWNVTRGGRSYVEWTPFVEAPEYYAGYYPYWPYDPYFYGPYLYDPFWGWGPWI